MATKTRQDLIVATLKKLNAIGAGQSPEPEDVEEVETAIDGKLAELNRRGVISLPESDKFDIEFIDPLAIILADQLAPAFGQASSMDSRLGAETRLREMGNDSRVDDDVTPSCYY